VPESCRLLGPSLPLEFISNNCPWDSFLWWLTYRILKKLFFSHQQVWILMCPFVENMDIMEKHVRPATVSAYSWNSRVLCNKGLKFQSAHCNFLVFLFQINRAKRYHYGFDNFLRIIQKNLFRNTHLRSWTITRFW
jgi:hypothetical protein